MDHSCNSCCFCFVDISYFWFGDISPRLVWIHKAFKEVCRVILFLLWSVDCHTCRSGHPGPYSAESYSLSLNCWKISQLCGHHTFTHQLILLDLQALIQNILWLLITHFSWICKVQTHVPHMNLTYFEYSSLILFLWEWIKGTVSMARINPVCEAISFAHSMRYTASCLL